MGGGGGATPRPNLDLGAAQVALPKPQTGRGSAPPNPQTPTDLGAAQVILVDFCVAKVKLLQWPD